MPAHVVAGGVFAGCGVHGEVGAAGEQFLEGDAGLEAGCGGSQAVVGAVAEGQVPGDVASDVEGLGVGPNSRSSRLAAP